MDIPKLGVKMEEFDHVLVDRNQLLHILHSQRVDPTGLDSCATHATLLMKELDDVLATALPKQSWCFMDGKRRLAVISKSD
jgi:hypothetical protein